MKWSEKFRGSYMKHADLGGQARRVTIANIGEEKIGDENKMILYFEETDQGLVVNKTNASVLQEAFGDEMAAVVGKKIILRPDECDFQGKRTGCVRISIPKKAELPAVAEDGVPY
jgi:hypothetical protein